MTVEKFNKIVQEAYLGYNGAFSEIYNEFYGTMFLDAFCILKNENDAHEATATAICNVLKHVTETKDFRTEYPKAYMKNAARNAALDLIEKRNETVSLDIIPEVADNAFSIDNVCGDMDLKNFLDSLTEKDKFIAENFFIHKDKQKNIAKEIGMPVNTVKTRVRAIKAAVIKYFK